MVGIRPKAWWVIVTAWSLSPWSCWAQLISFHCAVSWQKTWLVVVRQGPTWMGSCHLEYCWFTHQRKSSRIPRGPFFDNRALAQKWQMALLFITHWPDLVTWFHSPHEPRKYNFIVCLEEARTRMPWCFLNMDGFLSYCFLAMWQPYHHLDLDQGGQGIL
jgi:hypothetical protein